MLSEILKEKLFITTNNDNIFIIQIVLNCGAINESKGIMGYSHLLEHIKFNKFKNDKIEADSGIMNAYTSKDQTTYYVKCTEDKIKYAIELCVNIVFNTEFSDNRLENEKKIVYEEMYMTRTNDFLYNTLLETIMDKKKNNYSNKIIGRKADLRNATNKSLKAYNNFFYHLRNAKIVCSCSKNKKSKVVKLLETTLSKYNVPLECPTPQKYYNTHLDPCEFRRFNYSMIVHYNPFSEVNAVYLVFKTFDGQNADNLCMYFINYVLAYNNKKSLLFNMLREKQGLIYNIRSNIDLYKHFGMYLIGFNTSEDNIDDIIKDIFQIIYDYLLTQRKMTKSKFEKFKKMYLELVKFEMSDTNKAFEYMMRFNYMDKVMPLGEYIEFIEKMTLDNFTKVCNEALNLNKLGCYVISKKLSQKEHTIAFKNILQKFKNEV